MAEVETTKDVPATAEVEAQNEPQEETKPAPTEPEPEVETMRCVRLNGHGGYGKLKVEKHPKPKATDGNVVVKVHACGLNFADLMQRQGSYSEAPKVPYTPGLECSGVVEEIGEHVTGIEVGSRVCCITLFGSWAEFVAVPFTHCFVMPESMTFEEGAAFPVTYLTAYLMLFHCGNIKRRKSILIHMAAGGVGTAATQLCKTVEGLKIFGTASASKHEMIKEFGVDHPIDYRTQDYVHAIKDITHGVDLILEPLSGSDTKKCYDLLNPMGAMICFGYANQISESKGVFSAAKNWFQGVTFNPTKMIPDNKTVCGFHLGRIYTSIDLIRDAMKDLMKLYNDGALKPCIDSVFALEEVAKAQQKMHERKNIGKILLSPLKEPEPEPEPEPKKKKRSESKVEAEQKPNGEAEEAKPDAKEGEKEEP
ncbi:synaptic vesicle membrane protein VAT-1 homolog, partial [Actinia tenebrosa]|uniref:Synaptic vesicle membrane protein VAT-1 homolog n=1 Tax=Actinia tenebrosa TaxID=6105 RepID=A0A6P8I1L8_ACTTE